MRTSISTLVLIVLGSFELRSDVVLAANENVTVVELRQTDDALKETYAKGKRMVLPRMVMLDAGGRAVYAGVGLPSDLARRLHKALSDDRPVNSLMSLEAVLAETVRPDGSHIAVGDLPKGDAYVIDYWAAWCAPCRMLSRDLGSALRRWDDKKFVWLKVESDPKKASD